MFFELSKWSENQNLRGEMLAVEFFLVFKNSAPPAYFRTSSPPVCRVLAPQALMSRNIRSLRHWPDHESAREDLKFESDVYPDGRPLVRGSVLAGRRGLYTTRRRCAQEHDMFLLGLKQYGREWKKVAEKIKTRTSAQVRGARRE